MGSRTITCRDCGQKITRVASSATGNTMVIDPYPQQGGNIRLRTDPLRGLVADVLSRARSAQAADAGVPTYKVHQAGCRALHPPDAPAKPQQLTLGGGA